MTSHSMKNLAVHSLLRWKMIILLIPTTSLVRFPLKGWENVLFELRGDRSKALLPRAPAPVQRGIPSCHFRSKLLGRGTSHKWTLPQSNPSIWGQDKANRSTCNQLRRESQLGCITGRDTVEIRIWHHSNLAVRKIMEAMRAAYAKSGIWCQDVSNYTRQTITKDTRVLWKESAYRLRTTFQFFAESFGGEGAFEMRHS